MTEDECTDATSRASNPIVHAIGIASKNEDETWRLIKNAIDVDAVSLRLRDHLVAVEASIARYRDEAGEYDEHVRDTLISHHEREHENLRAQLEYHMKKIIDRIRYRVQRATARCRAPRTIVQHSSRHARVSHRVGVARVARKSATKSSTGDPDSDGDPDSARAAASSIGGAL